ncbi:MAG: hypothetical protein RLZZ292_481 [Bacteroidota bacterium]
MKKLLYLFLFLFPFLIVIMVNESQRGKNYRKPYFVHGIPTLHSVEKTPEYCTWYCHNDTQYCIETHNKIIKGDFLIFTNRIYFGIIAFLGSIKGGYVVMNILVLVVGLPLLMWGLAVRAIRNYSIWQSYSKNK